MLFNRETDYDGLIAPVAVTRGVPFALAKGIIAQESGFNPNARAETGGDALLGGSYGLMQVSLQLARDYGFSGDSTALLEPEANITIGIRYLAVCLSQVDGSWGGAASAYNGGYRPHIGFGRVVALDTTVQLRAGGSRVVPAGQFFNQAYVDAVLNFASYYGQTQ